MSSPFVMSSFDTIVLPLGKDKDHADCTRCIVIYGESELDRGPWYFSERSIQTWQVVDDPNHRYHEALKHPRPLTEIEEKKVIEAISSLIALGWEGKRVADSLAFMRTWGHQIPQDLTNG